LLWAFVDGRGERRRRMRERIWKDCERTEDIPPLLLLLLRLLLLSPPGSSEKRKEGQRTTTGGDRICGSRSGSGSSSRPWDRRTCPPASKSMILLYVKMYAIRTPSSTPSPALVQAPTYLSTAATMGNTHSGGVGLGHGKGGGARYLQ
jgi:hypothetical protein